jgi:hypothetical protein
MGSIKVQDLRVSEKVKDVTIISYPAMLLGNMGIDQKFREKIWFVDMRPLYRFS